MTGILRAVPGPPAESGRDGGRNGPRAEGRKRAERRGAETVLRVAREAEHGECSPGRQRDPRHAARQERGNGERARRLVADEIELESRKLGARLGRRVGCRLDALVRRVRSRRGKRGARCVARGAPSEERARRPTPTPERDEQAPRNAQNGSREIAFSMRSTNGCLSSASVSFG